MTPFIQLASSLKEQMHATLSRSDVLKPLAWVLGILLTGLALLAVAGTPSWIINAVGVSWLIFAVIYAASFLYCLFFDRDALRSETYSLQKMAIEHGLYGDNRIGLIDRDPKGGSSSKPLALPITPAESDDE